MLEALLWISAGLWALFLAQLVLNRALLPDLRKQAPTWPDRPPLVSIVVPARNEEACIREAVTSFCAQDYPAVEVVVVDDRSTDRTPRILADLQQRFARLRVVEGHDPPPGWLGKPNALEIGRQAARGDWLLFVDADVIYAPDLLRRAMAYALDRDLGMLFVMPRLVTKGAGEAVLMSTLPLVALAASPAFLVNRLGWKRLAVGGGAFNLVRRDALDACGAFASLKDAIIDDIMLGYKVKGAGFPLHFVNGGELLRVRMYDGARATIRGFTKNTYPGLLRKPWYLPLPFVLGLVASLLPYGALARDLLAGAISPPVCIALVLMHLTLAGVAWWQRLPWYVVLLNPLRELGWMWIVIRSMWLYYRRGLVWRDRNYGSVQSI